MGGHSRWAQGGFRGPAHVRVCSASSTAVSLFGTSPYPVIAATGVQAVLHAECLELHIAIASAVCRPAGMAFLGGRKERGKGRWGGVQRSRPLASARRQDRRAAVDGWGWPVEVLAFGSPSLGG